MAKRIDGSDELSSSRSSRDRRDDLDRRTKEGRLCTGADDAISDFFSPSLFLQDHDWARHVVTEGLYTVVNRNRA